MGNQLNLSLPVPYYARLEMRPEVGIVEEPLKHQWVEVRDASRGHKRITLIGPPEAAALIVHGEKGESRTEVSRRLNRLLID